MSKVAAPGRLDGPVLVSTLASGACFLLVLAVVSWPLAAIGAAYVSVAGVFLAAVYALPSLTRRQELAAWVAPWLAAVALWTWLVSGIDGGSWLADVWVGLVVATPCYVAWQVGALAVRRFLRCRAAATPA